MKAQSQFTRILAIQDTNEPEFERLIQAMTRVEIVRLIEWSKGTVNLRKIIKALSK